jgi:16S rRNA (uracil1498-N3)-methyltransferase
MRRAKVDTLPREGELLVLPTEVLHHLTRVLRLAPGTIVELFDGQGRCAEAELLDDSRVRVLTPSVLVAPHHELHLVIGVLKGPAMDLALRASTEVGMTHLHAVRTQRAVPTKARADRWERVVQAAARQCGRADVPTITWHERLREALEATRHVSTRRIGIPGGPSLSATTGDAAVLIGPEGGLAPREIEQAFADGYEAMGLGRWVLRACTAAPIALAATRA